MTFRRSQRLFSTQAWRQLLLALCLLPLAASAAKVYKYIDENGITHYTDRKPADGIKVDVIAVRAEVQAIVDLRVESHGDARRAVVSNRIAGPIEVELQFERADNIASVPPLPLRIVVPAMAEQRVAEFSSYNTRAAAGFSLKMKAVPGDPGARPDHTPFMLPLAGSAWRIDQGFGGSFSHTDPHAWHAVDFAVDEGTPVLAARDGIVMQVDDDFEGAGLDRDRFGARANAVRLLHADGSMSVYAHLQPDSVVVIPGRRVRAGQRLAASGNTGYSSGPHLHFAVQVNRGMALQSVDFELQGANGRIPIPSEPGQR